MNTRASTAIALLAGLSVIACSLSVVPTATPTPASTATSAPAAGPTAFPRRDLSKRPLVWFAPNMGSTDYADLFTKPAEWTQARSRIDVFELYSQNALPYACTVCGDNTLDRFVGVKAFETLRQWGFPIAVELGAVKEWGCTGTREFQVTREVIGNIRNHGGEVTFLVMDEPYMGGELTANGKTCGFSMEQSADVAAKWMGLVRSSYPEIIIGETEPYPYFSVQELEAWIVALESRGAAPAFFHIDVNLREGGWRRPDAQVSADLQTLGTFFQEHGITFGVILTADGAVDSDRAYWDSTMSWLRLVKSAIGTPADVIFQSWLGSGAGPHTIPINLPDDDPTTYSHTRLILEGLNLLGQ